MKVNSDEVVIKEEKKRSVCFRVVLAHFSPKHVDLINRTTEQVSLFILTHLMCHRKA